MILKYRKKPVVIEAILLTENNLLDAAKWAHVGLYNGTLRINTLEGEMVAKPGDFLIRGIKGEYYPCKADIFKASYESVTL